MADALISKGNDLFVEEQYEQALAAYNEAIDLDDANSKYYLKRAAAHEKLAMWTETIADARSALEHNSALPKAYVRQGVAFTQLKQYREARQALLKAQELGDKSARVTEMIRACEGKMSAKELAGPLRMTPGSASAGASASVSSAAPPMDVDPIPAPKTAALRIKHQHYQTATHVVITVLAKGLSAEQVEVEFGETTLSVTAKLHTGSDYSLELDLWAPVIPAESSFRVLKTKLEISLKKSSSAQWLELEGNGCGGLAPAMADAVADGGADKPKPKGKDWDKIEAEVKKEEENEPLEGDAALQKLFRDIYSQGNEELQRAMNKSFVESNGTVLSTNWGEVGTGKVDMKPPEDVEFKEYEQ